MIWLLERDQEPVGGWVGTAILHSRPGICRFLLCLYLYFILTKTPFRLVPLIYLLFFRYFNILWRKPWSSTWWSVEQVQGFTDIYCKLYKCCHNWLQCPAAGVRNFCRYSCSEPLIYGYRSFYIGQSFSYPIPGPIPYLTLFSSLPHPCSLPTAHSPQLRSHGAFPCPALSAPQKSVCGQTGWWRRLSAGSRPSTTPASRGATTPAPGTAGWLRPKLTSWMLKTHNGTATSWTPPIRNTHDK